MRVTPVTDAEFMNLARRSGHPIPIEQSPAWDAFDAAVEGRAPWRRLALVPDHEGEEGGAVTPASAGQGVAVISLSSYVGRGFRYLWARHGPLWLTDPTAAQERELREALRAYVRTEAPDIDFIRMHATHAAPDLRELMQTVTYDRTVILDLTLPADEYLAGLAKKFRYTVRKALQHEHTVVSDESGLTREDFAELYEIYRETADRDDFGIFPADVYWTMITALRPHSRVFVARRTDAEDGPGAHGRAVAWTIITVYDGAANYYYAAANAEARESDASVRLLWDALEALRNEGVTRFDMMGVDSERAPQLSGVGRFKRKWGPEVEVDGAWDAPVRPQRYRLLRLALRVKRLLSR